MKEDILNKPIGNLGMSANFCEKSRLMGFKTLNDIILLGPKNIFEKKGFSHIWLGELSKFLIEQNMLSLLQAT